MLAKTMTTQTDSNMLSPGYLVGSSSESQKHPLNHLTIYLGPSQYDGRCYNIWTYQNSFDDTGILQVKMLCHFQYTTEVILIKRLLPDVGNIISFKIKNPTVHYPPLFRISQEDLPLYIDKGILIPLDENEILLHEYNVI